MHHFFVKSAFQWAVKFVIPLASVALVIVFGMAYFTFAAPTLTPAGGNPAYPLNDSAQAQTKAGELTLQSTVDASSLTSSETNATTVCISGDCATAWPGGNYTAPTLAQVLASGNSTTRRLYMYDSIGGFNFNGSGYRREWYTGRLYNGPKYGTGGQCSQGYVVCQVVGAYAFQGWYCCQVLVQTY